MTQKFYGSISLQNSQEIRFYNLNSSAFVSFKAPDSLVVNTAWTLPLIDGAANAVLITDGAGQLSFQSLTTSNVPEGSNQYFTTERAQDAVGAALTDTASIDLTYNDVGNQISAVVLPAGVDHDLLQNYVANEHIDHTSVQIATGSTSGLNGGGDISSTRNIVVAPERATSKTTAVAADLLLIADSEASNALKSITIQKILDLVTPAVSGFATDWVTADGSTKTVTHNLGTKDVIVQVFDKDDDSTIFTDSVVRTSTNVVTITASSPPAQWWRVLVKAV